MIAQSHSSAGVPATVMLLGTFHFANSGQDAVKNAVNDVMSVESQAYLEGLAQRISKFKATTILLEYDQNEDPKINARYTQYRMGDYQLSTNEIEQLGFRIGKLSGLDRLYSFDERNIPWKAKELFEQLKRESGLEKYFNEAIRKMTEDEEMAHSSQSLKQLLQRYNSPDMDHLNKSLYLMTNVAGADENFDGANATASWWHRNFRMFARIQKHAQPGKRVLAIGGQGHIALMRDFLILDSRLQSEEVMSYL